MRDYEQELKEIARRSDIGTEFHRHGFTVWSENGTSKTSGIIRGNEETVSVPRKYNEQECILVRTYPSSEPGFYWSIFLSLLLSLMILEEPQQALLS